MEDIVVGPAAVARPLFGRPAVQRVCVVVWLGGCESSVRGSNGVCVGCGWCVLVCVDAVLRRMWGL